MGNEGNSGKSGKSNQKSKKGSSKAEWIKLNDKERQGILSYCKKFVGDNKEFKSDKFISTIFTYISKEISSNINNFLNSYYSEVKSSRKLQPQQKLEIISTKNIN